VLAEFATKPKPDAVTLAGHLAVRSTMGLCNKPAFVELRHSPWVAKIKLRPTLHENPGVICVARASDIATGHVGVTGEQRRGS
jgi:hypothetical protein